MIKAIVFDFFGVIHTDIYNAWLSRHGLSRAGDLFDASNEVDIDAITPYEFFTRLGTHTGQTAQEIEREFEMVALDENVIALIKELRASYTVGLLSNASGPFLRRILQSEQIEPLFDPILISGEVKMIKPSQEIFELLLRQLNLKPQQVVFIDDNPQHVVGAKKVGIDAIQYQNIDQLKQELKSRVIVTT